MSTNFYLTAFIRLSTCRSVGMGPGPIPYNRIVEYAEKEKLGPELAGYFEDVINYLDNDYLEKEAEKNSKRNNKQQRIGNKTVVK